MTIDCAKAGTPSIASTFEADGSDAPLTKRRKAGLAAERCPSVVCTVARLRGDLRRFRIERNGRSGRAGGLRNWSRSFAAPSTYRQWPGCRSAHPGPL